MTTLRLVVERSQCLDGFPRHDVDRVSTDIVEDQPRSRGDRLVASADVQQAGERRRQGFEQALKRRRLKPATREDATAIVAHNDLLALDLIDEIERSGRSVPRDISVTGHDDIPLAAHSRIGLTTVRSDAQSMGQRAVELMMKAVRAGGHVGHREIRTNRLVIRQSTGAAPT